MMWLSNTRSCELLAWNGTIMAVDNIFADGWWRKSEECADERRTTLNVKRDTTAPRVQSKVRE